MKKHLFAAFAACALCCLMLVPSFAVPASHWDWTREPWTQSDTPYKKVLEDVRAQFKARNLTDKRLKELRAIASKHPKDALARYKWAAYGYSMALLEPDVSPGSAKLGGLRQAFRENPSPHTYEYTRIRYLVESYLHQSGSAMAMLGERLLKRKADDAQVKWYLVSHLFTGKPDDERKAIKYAQELVQQHPQEGSYYSLLGYVYQRHWWMSKNRDDAQKAIANYQKYLELAKPTGITRQRMENNIKQIQERM